jgi:hypothetical protein
MSIIIFLLFFISFKNYSVQAIDETVYHVDCYGYPCCSPSTFFCYSNSQMGYCKSDGSSIYYIACPQGACSSGDCISNNYSCNASSAGGCNVSGVGLISPESCRNGLRCVLDSLSDQYCAIRDDTCCSTGYVTSSASPPSCVAGCRRIDNNVIVGRSSTQYPSSYCFVTSPSNCDLSPVGSGVDPAHASNNVCNFDGASYCSCTSGGWTKSGHGCWNSTLNCNNTNGWYNTSSGALNSLPGSTTYTTTTISCSPCGNSARTCYKATPQAGCTTSAQCGDPCLICSSGFCVTNPTCSSCTYQNPTDRTTCLNWGGTCSNPANYSKPLTYSGLCTGGSDCVCTKEDPTCQAKTAATATTCANWGGTCSNPADYINPVTYSGLCTGGSECVCTKEGCVPNCSAASSYCTNQTFADGCGGTCAGTKAIVNGG